MTKKAAIKFVVLLGFVSLLADITYEGARSILGPYFLSLGASALAIATAAGFGEFIGYGARLIFGALSDKTKRYWAFTLLGYAINLLAVPLLALAGNWKIAFLLVILERLGKAIRAPARDAILSQATHHVGHGFGFGLHEAMDQIGAIAGPLIMAGVLYFNKDYRMGFALLGLPAILALSVLLLARFIYTNPNTEQPTLSQENKNFPKIFWLYLVAASFMAAGFLDFPLIAYHLDKTSKISGNLIPLVYAMAMATDAIAAIALGRLFDRIGISSLMISFILTSLSAPLIFLGNPSFILLGMILWGVGLGAQESIMRAFVAQIIPSQKRATAFGIFNAGYGLSWFLGSVLMGLLYSASPIFLVIFSTGLQIASVLFLMRHNHSFFPHLQGQGGTPN